MFFQSVEVLADEFIAPLGLDVAALAWALDMLKAENRCHLLSASARRYDGCCSVLDNKQVRKLRVHITVLLARLL